MIKKFSSRRDFFGAALSLAAAPAALADAPRRDAPPLKSLTNAPMGCSTNLVALKDPAYAALLLRNFSQVTPEYEMKMNPITHTDGRLNFTLADNFMGFARQNRLRVHATTLVWYKHQPPYFMGLDGKGQVFADAYRNYLLTVVGRYRGQVVGWDVVNEPVWTDGTRLRDSLWSSNLGAEDYMMLAFEYAKQADPNAVLFINEFDLERLPRKRATFLNLVERLLKRGAKIDGIGTQSHVNINLPQGASTLTMRDLAALGLKIHVSELDVSLGRADRDNRSMDDKLKLQSAKAWEVVDAFMNLPASQRYALTMWGLMDKNTWLRQLPGREHDEPLAFYDDGQPKPMFWAMADRLKTR